MDVINLQLFDFAMAESVVPKTLLSVQQLMLQEIILLGVPIVIDLLKVGD
jgi:hypothetical protein